MCVKKLRITPLALHRRLGSQVDMAEVKHSDWCRKEIDSAHTDLAVAASGRLRPAARIKRYVDLPQQASFWFRLTCFAVTTLPLIARLM